MQLFELVKPRVAVIFGSVLMLALLFGVACGSAAPAEQTAPAATAPAAAEPAAAEPAAASAQQPAPTAVPQAAAQPEVPRRRSTPAR